MTKAEKDLVEKAVETAKEETKEKKAEKDLVEKAVETAKEETKEKKMKAKKPYKPKVINKVMKLIRLLLLVLICYWISITGMGMNCLILIILAWNNQLLMFFTFLH
jgi:ABC-type phosphate/phosphonate transport system permease subunit